MIADGERLKTLFSKATSEVIICAPFVKSNPLNTLIQMINLDVFIRVYTRWLPHEVALGVSDLEVYDILRSRENSKVYLVDNLHAKLYIADDECLVGSANITGSALGWNSNPNVEILIEESRYNDHIQMLIKRLSYAIPASSKIRNDIREQADKLSDLNNLFPKNESSSKANFIMPWLPKCAAPEKLYSVYIDNNTSLVTAGTKQDAIEDLDKLMPPQGLNEGQFIQYVSEVLLQIPSISQVLDQIPRRVSDPEGARLINELCPGMNDADTQRQWSILRDWIRIFFADKFEVAPESYVVRLKSG